MRKVNIIILALVLASFAVGIYFYPQMPDRVASHWNTHGEVDGYMPKFWGVFLMPVISLAIALLFMVIPKIDPLKDNIQKFRKYFDGFLMLLILFLFYIYILTILWNIGFRFNLAYYILPALSVLFYYCGILIEHAKRNWFVGIRTPWTLSNDLVWEKTHRLGGKLFKAAAIVSLLGLIFPEYVFLFFIIPIFSAALYPVVYSYLEFRKLSKNS